MDNSEGKGRWKGQRRYSEREREEERKEKVDKTGDKCKNREGNGMKIKVERNVLVKSGERMWMKGEENLS